MSRTDTLHLMSGTLDTSGSGGADRLAEVAVAFESEPRPDDLVPDGPHPGPVPDDLDEGLVDDLVEPSSAGEFGPYEDVPLFDAPAPAEPVAVPPAPSPVVAAPAAPKVRQRPSRAKANKK